MFETFSNSQELIPKYEVGIIPNPEEMIRNPEKIFSKNSTTTTEQRYAKHRFYRRLISDKDLFLGIGNNGFVCSTRDSENGTVCSKLIWKTLRIIPNKGLPIADLKNYGDEISALYNIQEEFKLKRQGNKKLMAGGNKENVPSNTPEAEACLQEICRRFLESGGINCTVPVVRSVFNYSEKEEDYEDYSYFLDDDYVAIDMEQVKGKSLQDIILGFPDTKEFLDQINLEDFSRDLTLAIKELHRNGIQHNDITIRNIMFDTENRRPAIIDFGKTTINSNQVSEKKEMEHLQEAINHLKDFLKDPQKKRVDLIRELKKRNLKAGFIFN